MEAIRNTNLVRKIGLVAFCLVTAVAVAAMIFANAAIAKSTASVEISDADIEISNSVMNTESESHGSPGQHNGSSNHGSAAAPDDQDHEGCDWKKKSLPQASSI